VARSTLHKPIGVPLCAVAVSRAFRINANNDVAHAKFKQASGNKRRKVIPDISLLGLAAITASEEEDISDINFLFSDDENKGESGEKHPK
jgi:ubiquitin-conjugating enzyme E2 Q